MLCLKNELGWRLEKRLGVYIIPTPHPPLRSRIMQFVPALVGVLLVVCLLAGRDLATRIIFCAIAGLLLLWLMARGRFRHYIPHLITGLIIFVSLVVRNDITIGPALFSIPLMLLFGLLAFRPFIVIINPRMRLVVLGDLVTKIPFSMLKIDIDVCSQTGRHKVFLRNTEQIRVDSEFEINTFECMAWESNSETEANRIVEQLRTLGVGTDDPIQKDQFVPANKKACALFLAGYVVAVAILIALMMCMSRYYDKSVEEDQLKLIMRVVRIIIAFIFLSITPFAVYLSRLGRRAVRYRHMPPPGTVILMNTKVLEGDAAVKRGRILIVIGIVLFVLSLIFGLILPYLLGEMYLRHLPGWE